MAPQSPPLGIFAAGLGTRLFGRYGGCKALTLVAGRPIIDYILNSAYRYGVKRVTVVVRTDDAALIAFLARDLRFDQLEIVRRDEPGTAGAVTSLIEILGDQDFFLSTCDLIGPTSVLSDLEQKLALVRKKGLNPLAVFLATRWVHDDTPIWIEADQDDVVLRYGKKIPPAPLVFGNIRLCSSNMRESLDLVSGDRIKTDTELMSAILARAPGRFVVAELAERVFDIDGDEDVRLAEEFIRRTDLGGK